MEIVSACEEGGDAHGEHRRLGTCNRHTTLSTCTRRYFSDDFSEWINFRTDRQTVV